ncbi:CHAD domain-containing protein [Arthrobacter sp. H5]|uniref:CHAD domain-containing protein n=1 Tax=Arthrobacter sp. H5 TaxID=1267973 RepID=UPI0004B30EEE|nr:CHAD domain-containing protein [Arthrobacter sp. H5]
MTSAGVPLDYIREQILAISLQEPLVRENEPDAVHHMRVGTRRLRSVLATYRTLLGNDDDVAHLRAELKWLAGVLGRARDTQVMHQRLRELINREAAELLMGPVGRSVDVELTAEYQSAHGQAVEALDTPRYFKLLRALDEFSAGSTALAPGSAGRLVRKERKRLRKAVLRWKDASDEQRTDELLHVVRKQAKRLRYAAEAAEGRKAARLARPAHKLQRILGHHQDSVMARGLLRRLGAEAHLNGENGFSFGRLHGLEQCRAAVAERKFAQAWKKFQRR